LYTYLETSARAQEMQSLFVEASLFAKPFFAQRGFVVVRQNDTKRLGEVLLNWTMEKNLLPATAE
jgi:putative acetyltransferase